MCTILCFAYNRWQALRTFFHFFCANDAGELVLAPYDVNTGPFCVYYYHPQKDTMRRVYIEGINEVKVPLWDKDSYHKIISVFPGHVDNLMFL